MTYYLATNDIHDVSISFTRYLRKIAILPMLTEDEEKDLATRFSEDNDRAAGQLLVTSHLKLVVKIAMLYKYRGCDISIMDLISEGTIGLIEAVKKFDLAKNCRLATYAMHYIKAKIYNFIMNSFSLVKLSGARVTKSLFAKYRDLASAVSDDDLQNIANQVSTSKKNVGEMKHRLLSRDCSLNEMMCGHGGSSGEWQDILVCKNDTPEDLAIHNDERSKYLACIKEACENVLDKDEREIIFHRIISEKPKKLKEMAIHYNLSAERIRQKQEIALKKIREYMTHAGLIGKGITTINL